MNSRIIALLLGTAALAAAGGWFAARQSAGPKVSETPNGRKILFYQSPMHPWIKSDKPGNCTICGMKLTPVHEGEKGFDAGAEMVSLPTNAITVVNVQTDEVKRRPLVRTLRVAGRIDDNDTRRRFVSAYADGRIETLAVNYVGAEVVEAGPLATFYSPQLLTAEREYLSLRNDARAISGDAANASVLATEHAKLVESAAQRLKRLGLTEAQIEHLAHKQETDTHTEISAPVSGTVVQRFVYAGQYVKEGDKLFEIADFSTMWFQFEAYERDLGWIKPGELVEVTTPSVPGRVFTAPVAFIDPNLNDMTRSARVRVELPNPLVEENGQQRRLLLHRLYAEGVVRAATPLVLAVPRSAVLQPGSQALVYVDHGNGAYEQRRPKLGRMGDDAWEVIEGISEGERVVTAGNFLIDAQAQLNQTAQPDVGPGHEWHTGLPQAPAAASAATTAITAASPGVAATVMEKLTDRQTKVARDFLVVANAMSAALAGDKVDGFNQEAAKLHAVLPALVQAFKAARSWQPFVEKLNSVGHFARAADLQAARKAFAPFSSAAVEFARGLRRQGSEFASVKVFQCPMTNRAFPGAPKSALWLQLVGPTQNPFFGAEMLDCGTEVTP